LSVQNQSVMKNIFKSPLLYLALLVGACNSFDQEAFNEGLQDGQELDYTVPTEVPADESEFKLLIHGDDKNQWTPEEFTLEGLLGFQDCRLDDTMTLRQDGTYQFDGGTMSCGGDDVAERSGVYIQDYVNKRLIFDEGTSDEVTMQISGLDQGVIAVSGEVAIFGVPMTVRGVYTAQ